LTASVLVNASMAHSDSGAFLGVIRDLVENLLGGLGTSG